MLKSEIIQLAEQWGYVIACESYSSKSDQIVWTLRVPTRRSQKNPHVINERKLFEDSELFLLLQRTRFYFKGQTSSPIKILRRHKVEGEFIQCHLRTI